MGLMLRRVGEDHWICQEWWDFGPKDVERSIHHTGKVFLCGLGAATQAVVAYLDGEVIGFARVWEEDGQFHSGGTWVKKQHRGRGLALRMWGKLFDAGNCPVEFVTVTPAGRGLVRYLDLVHPGCVYHRPDSRFFP